MADQRLSDDQLASLKDRLLGTCDSLTSVMEEMDLEGFSLEHVEDRLLDDPGGGALELCDGCQWWFHSHSLTEANKDSVRVFLCDQCLEDEDQ